MESFLQLQFWLENVFFWQISKRSYSSDLIKHVRDHHDRLYSPESWWAHAESAPSSWAARSSVHTLALPAPCYYLLDEFVKDKNI